MITLIAAAGEDNALGKGSQLLWHLPNDFKHFKSLTTGHCIIMGRKTFETFPKPLPQRTHIVITRQEDYLVPQGVYVAHSLPEALGGYTILSPKPTSSSLSSTPRGSSLQPKPFPPTSGTPIPTPSKDLLKNKR